MRKYLAILLALVLILALVPSNAIFAKPASVNQDPLQQTTVTDGTASDISSSTTEVKTETVANGEDQTMHANALSMAYTIQLTSYPNNYNHTWTIKKSGAANIRAHFVYIDTEPNYDYLYTDVGDYWSGSYSGVWSNWSYGDTINLTLYSDADVTKKGFYIDKIEYVPTYISLGTVSGSVQTEYTLNITSPATYYFYTEYYNRNCDTVLTLYDANHNEIAAAYYGVCAELWLGTYYLKVTNVLDAKPVYCYVKMSEYNPLYPYISIASPSNGASYVLGQPVNITAYGTYCYNMSLYINGVCYSSSDSTLKDRTLTYTFTPPAAGSYTITVSGRTTAGTNDWETTYGSTTYTITVDTQAPTAPTNLAVSSQTANSALLTWTAATDNVGVASYRIYRDSTQVGTSTTTSFTDNTAGLAQSAYNYTVKAVDFVGNVSQSSNTAIYDTQPPTVPTNLKITSASTSSISLSWTAATDNVGITGYKIYRGSTQVGTAAGTSYTDSITSALAQGTYNYTVRAVDVGGNESLDSNAVLYDHQPPTVPTGLQAISSTEKSIMLGWNASTDNSWVAGYEIYRDGVKIGSSSGNTFISAPLTPNKSYTFTVKAYDAVGNTSSQSTSITASTKPDTQSPTIPTGLTATNVTETTIPLTWSASTDNTGIREYRVYSNGTLLSRPTSTTTTPTWRTPGTTYVFTVTAVDLGGNESQPSEPLTVTTLSDTQKPSAPTGLTVTGATENSVSLSWNASTDNSWVTGYEIYRNGIKISSIPNTTFTSTPLTIGKSYTFTVKAYDVAGNVSDASAPITGSTLPDTTPPTVPTGLQATSSTETSITLGWNASTDNSWIAGYDVYRDGVQIGSTSGRTFTSTPLTPSKSYTFTVRAYDSVGNYSNQSTPITASTNPDTQSPTVPIGLTATNITETSVALTWSASTDNIGIREYRVYSNGNLLSSPTSTTTTPTWLTPGTTYVFTVIAIDLDGNESQPSEPLSVTTLSDTQKPSTPIGLTVTGVTQTSASLSWTASTDNSWVVSYEVYRDGVKVGSTSGRTFTSTPLTPSKSYTFTVKAIDIAGNVSDESTPITASTMQDTQAPTAPSGLVATNITETSVTLTWSASTDNSGIREYKVYSNGSLLASPTSTTTTPTWRTPGTTYVFTVAAIDLDGNESQPSQPLSVTTLSDTQKPSTPTGLTVTGTTETSASLSWTASTDNSWVAGYKVYRDGVEIGSPTGQTFTSTPLTPNESYAFTIRAYDVAGNISDESTPITVSTMQDTQIPTAPSGLTATNITETSVALTWSASTDNTGIREYKVYSDGSLLARPTSTTTTPTWRTPGTTYVFTVTAIDLDGNESQASEPLTVTTLSDTQKPSAPTGLTVTGATENSVSLSWNASTDNSWIEGYEIYCDGVKISSIPNTTFTSTPLTIGKSYTFTVKAYDVAGNISDASAPIIGSTLPDTTSPTVPTGLQATSTTETGITLEWTASTDNSWIGGYEIYRDGEKIGSTPGLTFTSTPLTPDKSYTFTVRAYDSVGNYSNQSTPITVSTNSDTELPTVPIELTATDITETSVTLTWSASTDNAGIREYRVYVNGSLLLARPTSNTTTLTWLTPDSTFEFTVTAVDLGGNESQPSESLSVTTLSET